MLPSSKENVLMSLMLQLGKPARYVRMVFGIGVIILVLGFFGTRAAQSFDLVRQTWQPVNWFYLILSVVLLAVCLLLMAVLWYVILRTIGGQISVATAIRLYGLTLLPRYIPGGIWGYAGRTVLCERAGVPRRLTVNSTMLEVAFIVGAGITTILLRDLLLQIAIVAVLLGLALFGGLLVTIRLCHRTPARYFRLGLSWYVIYLLYVVFWIVYGSTYILMITAVTSRFEVGYSFTILSAAAIAWLIGLFIVFVPGGLGVREGMLIVILTPIIGGINSVFVSLLARAGSIVAEFMFSFVCYVRNIRVNAKKHPSEQDI